jgi:hypothetical protein
VTGCLVWSITFKRVVLGLVTLPADVAAALVFRDSALCGRCIVAEFMAPGALDEGRMIPRAYKFDLSPEHAHPLARCLLADSVVLVKNSRDHCSCLFREVEGVALPVGGDREYRLGEARICSKGLEQVGFVKSIADVIFHIFHVDPSELDPSPASRRDYRRFTRENGAEDRAKGVDHLGGDVACEVEDVVTSFGYSVRPFPPENNGGVCGDSVKLPLDHLSNVGGVAFAERVFDISIFDSSFSNDDHIHESGRGVRVPGLDPPRRVTFLDLPGLMSRQ